MTEEQRDLLCRGLTRLGVPYTPEAVERLGLYCRRLLEKNQLKVIKFHELRHTCLSLLVQDGIPMKVVQEYARHANYSTTADIYSHLDKSAKLQALDLITNQLESAAS